MASTAKTDGACGLCGVDASDVMPLHRFRSRNIMTGVTDTRWVCEECIAEHKASKVERLHARVETLTKQLHKAQQQLRKLDETYKG